MSKTKSFFALFRLNLKAMLVGMGLAGGNRKKKASSGTIFFIILAIYAYIGVSYGQAIQNTLYPLGASELGFAFMLVLAFILCIIVSVSTSQGVIFGSKDCDFLFSLPVSEFSILLSKLCALYAENLVTFAAMLLPSCFIYQALDGFSPLFTVLYIIAVLIMPIMCCTVSVIFSFIVALLRSFFRGGRALSLIINFAALAAVMYVAVSMQTNLLNFTDVSEQSLNSLYARFFPAKLFGGLIFRHSVGCGVLLLISCIVPYLLVIWVFSKFYRRILTSLLENRTQNKKYALSDIKQHSVGTTLLKRELGRFFGTTTLAVNSGFGLIILIAAPFALFFARNKLFTVLNTVNGPALSSDTLMLLIASIALIICSTCYTSAVSVSLEGSSLWLIKSLPVKTVSVLRAKINANFILGAVPLIWCILLCGIILKTPILTVFILALYAACCFYACCCLGLIINLLLPKLDALTEVSVVKQSASAMAGLFSGMILLTLAAGLSYALSGVIGVNCAALITAAAYLALGALLNLFISRKGVRIFYSLI